MSDEDPRAHVTRLLRDGRICMFTTTNADGRLVSRPMALQAADFDGDLWFFAFDDSAKTAEIAGASHVNVSFGTKHDAWVSLSGTATVVHDRAKAEQLWNPMLRGWFPDGLDTPGIALIKVTAESAEYWDAPHGRVVSLIQYGAAALLRRTPPEGDNEVVELRPETD